mgnify:CR=1 FL=1
MKTTKWVMLLLAVMAITVTASMFAGDGHRCTASAEECAKKLQAKLSTHGWLGIETEKDANGRATITGVVPGSPAEKAGFAAGDVLAAINGIELGEGSKERLTKAKQKMGPGDEVTYTVLRKGAKLDVTARLTAMPPERIAQKIGEHILAEHLGVVVASK